jgi:hypothetical protein
VSAVPSTAPDDPVATKCLSVAPTNYAKYFTSETLTVAEIRAIVVNTLPPPPTSLLLPDHEASEKATMCWVTDGAGHFAQYWLTQDGQIGTVCTTPGLETLQPDDVGTIRCF